MSREVHVRFCEGLGVGFPWATPPYLKVGGIYRYLAVVMDKYSRRVVGWSYGRRKDVKLTLQALDQAVRARRPGSAIVFHTDRGIEYAAGAFKERIFEQQAR